MATLICPECGVRFTKGNRPGQAFCTTEHKTAYHNRSATRGKVLMPLLLAWRGKRGSGETAKLSFAEVCRLVDKFNAEDRAAGRPPSEAFAARQFRQGLRHQ